MLGFVAQINTHYTLWHRCNISEIGSSDAELSQPEFESIAGVSSAAYTLMQVTILICTHNRAKLLERTLRYLNAARRPDHCTFNILVATNACTDHTGEVLEAQAANQSALPIKWVSEPVPGKSNALNKAIPLVESSVIAFVDDDHRVDKNYLCTVADAISRYPEMDLFCGRILPDWDGSEPQWVHDTGPYRIYPLPVPRFDHGEDERELPPEGPIPGGGNLCIRTALFQRVGGFSMDYGPVGHDLGGAEDLEWVKRALATGARLVYVPDVIQYHYADPERLRPSYLMHKAYERSASAIRLSGKQSGVPLFAYRKTADYLFHAIFSISWTKRRFYLVRLAAALGEIKGYRAASAGD